MRSSPNFTNPYKQAFVYKSINQTMQKAAKQDSKPGNV